MTISDKIIMLIENEIEDFENKNDIGQRYANAQEEGYLSGLQKAIEIIQENITE